MEAVGDESNDIPLPSDPDYIDGSWELSHTGVITVYVGDEYIAVPVQTTLFNGRITKSGVAQGKLQGYNCGATVMLYYPQTDGYQNTEFNGYMNRNSDSLTVLVDVNGTDCKLLIKINGMKSLF